MILPTFHLVASVAKQLCVAYTINVGNDSSNNNNNSCLSNKLLKYNDRISSAIQILCPVTLLKPPLSILQSQYATTISPTTTVLSSSRATTTTISNISSKISSAQQKQHQQQQQQHQSSPFPPPQPPTRNVCVVVFLWLNIFLSLHFVFIVFSEFSHNQPTNRLTYTHHCMFNICLNVCLSVYFHTIFFVIFLFIIFS